MNALTPSMEALLLSSTAVKLGALPTAMGSNIGRDVKIRGAEFRTFEAAAFEYVVNAYESYDNDQIPVVEVTAKGHKLVVKDNGVGMNAEILLRYWMMHAGTVRRVNGRNKRGYYGSGKSAFYGIGTSIVVDTVRDGFRNSMSMTSEEVDLAADEGRAPAIVHGKVQEFTGGASGTTITIKLRKAVTPEQVRALRQKISENLRLVMTSAVVNVNEVKVEPRAVHGIETSVTSICGSFNATFTYNDGGHIEGDAQVFYKVGGCYIAAEQTGKEGHRFSHRVMVEVDTTEAWALEHFEYRREHFMSEARDLRLNANDPSAKELRDFADHVVSGFMKKLDEEDAQRAKEETTEQRKKLLDQMSRVMGSVMSFGGPLHVAREKGDKVRVERENVESKKRDSKGPNDSNRKPNITFEFRELHNHVSQYDLLSDMTVVFNTLSPAVKAIMQDGSDPNRQQLLWSLAAQAVAELETNKFIVDQEKANMPLSIAEAVNFQKRMVCAINDRLADIYRTCQA